MPTPQQLFNEYMDLRRNGFDATSALQHLRGSIELLPASERAAIVKQVKVWESHQTNPVIPSPIKPISIAPKNTAAEPRRTAPPAAATAPKPITCPNCGKTNDSKEVMCYSCGFVLQANNSAFSTMPLNAADSPARDDSHFGAGATLVLSLRGTNTAFRIQPQKQDHETIIGRSDGSAMQPDIDLVDLGAGQLGVSRLHIAIQYNAKHHTVCVSDMNSANGSFVNGQKLHPQEVRVLRHGDELRIGRMVFQVLFQQKA